VVSRAIPDTPECRTGSLSDPLAILSRMVLTDLPYIDIVALKYTIEAATSYRPALHEMLNVMRLHPESMQEPERWKIGYEHDTTLAGLPAFMAEDTLITPDRPMLYQEIYWVVNGYAFKAVYQGTPPNLPAFRALVNTIQFPDASR